jgi:hypothetical protein
VAPRCPRTSINSQRSPPAAPSEPGGNAGFEPAGNAREHSRNASLGRARRVPDRPVNHGQPRSLTDKSQYRPPGLMQVIARAVSAFQAGVTRPPRCTMISAESTESRPSRCAVASRALTRRPRPREMAATRRNGEDQDAAQQHAVSSDTSSNAAALSPTAVSHRPPELQFQLQFTAVQEGSRGTGQGRWSSLNRSGRPRPELLMQHTVQRGSTATPLTVASKYDRQHTELAGTTAKRPAVPLVRDEEAVPVRADIGGESRSATSTPIWVRRCKEPAWRTCPDPGLQDL